jgi:S-DNA-T family DNA segregation ATPase FtsK/SpoIIIE
MLSEGRQSTWFGRALRAIAIPSRLKEEILAFLLFVAAVILTLPLIGETDAALLGVFADGLKQSFGVAALGVPVALAILSVELWRADTPGDRARRLFGGAVLALSIVGLVTLGMPNTGWTEAGGWVGEVVTVLLQRLIGEVATAIVLFAVGVVGVVLVTGTDSRSLRQSWRRIRSRSRTGTADLDLEGGLPVGITVDDDATERLPGPEPTIDALDTPSRPVIRTPAPGAGLDEIRRAVADAVAQPQEEAPAVPAGSGWKLPKVSLLTSFKAADPDQIDLEAKALRIEETLASFKVEGHVREVFPGPAVTLFALEPGHGVKVSKITALQNDLALALAAPSIRIEAPVPGMARVGIEIPNADISTVGMRDILESPEMKANKAKLPLPLGRDVNGRPVIADLARMPHLLIAGATGSGKSVCINTIIATFLLTRTPDELQMLLIDPKKVELVGYKHVPHLKGPIVTEMDKVVSALRMVLHEMDRRYRMFAELGVRNIDGYNLRRDDDQDMENLPYLVVVIDELADLMMTTPDEVETLLARLCQMARATGIHMLVATQRPSVDVLTGLIKANVPARIAFAVTSLTDSRVILDMPGAERLLGRGDMLYMPPDAAKPVRVQGSFIPDPDLIRIVNFWRKQQPRHEFATEWAEFPIVDGDDAEDDPLRDQAVDIVRRQGTASASMLQRRLRIGYNRAARLIESMEEEGLIGPAEGARGRPVYVEEHED